jgi:hypothetical protein
MPVSVTTPGRAGTRAGAPVRAAFRLAYNVGTRSQSSFAARWLAYTLPCRRFAAALTGSNARLGANVGRYSFIVTDFHRLFLSGFTGAQAIRLLGFRSTSRARQACVVP